MHIEIKKYVNPVSKEIKHLAPNVININSPFRGIAASWGCICYISKPAGI